MGVQCFVCDKCFSNQSNLNKHRKKVHNLKPKIVSYDQSKYMYKCLEKNCNSSFRHNVGLKNHLTDGHRKQIKCEEKEFSNKEGKRVYEQFTLLKAWTLKFSVVNFLAWKKLMEKRNNSSNVLSHQNIKTNQLNIICAIDLVINKYLPSYISNSDFVLILFSGKVRTKSLNKRLLKSQGSCKLNRYCISMIKVIEGENLLVTWIKSHYGHTLDLQHIRLPQMDKSIVALGVPPSRILDSIRDKINEEDLSCEDLITRKDIQNIKTAYHLGRG